MTASSDTEIRDLLTKINQDIQEIKISQARSEEKLIGIEKRLDDTNKRIDDTNIRFTQLEGRLNTQTNWFLGIFGVLVAGLLTIIGKLGFFPNNP